MPGQAAFHKRVFEDVVVVVEIDEVRADDEGVRADDRNYQPENDISHHACFGRAVKRGCGVYNGAEGDFWHGQNRP